MLLEKHMQRVLKLALTDIIVMLGGKGDWVDAFLAVLFLSNSGKLTLEQDVFYGPLFIAKVLPPEPVQQMLDLFSAVQQKKGTSDNQASSSGQSQDTVVDLPRVADNLILE